MYRVIVIEDNYYTRLAILQSFDWASLGCEIAGEASNGLDGEKLAIECTPQIIITDIRMPGYDGIEMVSRLRDILPPFKVIVLTGYQNFSYAQAFVKLGALDFLLKPIKTQELYQAVQTAVSQLETENRTKKSILNARSEIKDLHLRLNTSLLTMQKELVYNLFFDSSSSEEELIQRTAAAGIVLKGYIVMYITGEKLGSLSQVIEQIPRQDFMDVYDIHINHEKILFLFSRKEAESWIFESEAQKVAKKVICQEGFFQAYIGMSRYGKKLSSICAAYDGAKATAGSLRLKKGKNIAFALDNRTEEDFDIEEVAEELSQTDEIKLQAKVDQTIAEIVQKTGSIASLRSFLIQLCSRIDQNFSKYSIVEEHDRETKERERILSIQNIGTVDMANKFLLGFLSGHRARLEKSNYSPVVQCVMDYINLHYDDDISLNYLADVFFLSPTYLSSLFKRETNRNFVDVLTQIRIEKAKKLLLDPRLQVQQVSQMVGYKEYAYFYQVFKKYTNQSPKQYRKSGGISR